MMRNQDEIDETILRYLNGLQTVPERNPHKAALGREKYLVQVRTIAREMKTSQAVSLTIFQRLNGWINSINKTQRRKEHVSMLTTLASLIMAITLLFGGAGASVYAAQESLPDQLLYPVKMFSEDVQVDLAADPQNQIELLLTFTDRRLDEVVAMSLSGEPVPEHVFTRLQTQMRLMLQLAAGLDEPDMEKSMERIRLHTRDQDQRMSRLRVKDQSQEGATLSRVRTMLREQIRLVEEGQEDPLRYRQQYQWRYEKDGPLPTKTVTKTPVPGKGPGPEADPGEGSGGGENPGSGAGPGPGAGPNPGEGFENKNGDEQGLGAGPGPKNDSGGGDQDNGQDRGKKDDPGPNENPKEGQGSESGSSSRKDSSTEGTQESKGENTGSGGSGSGSNR